MSNVVVDDTHRLSVVIPVYRGERTLRAVIEELKPYVEGFDTPKGIRARIDEVVLCYDHGPDASDEVIRQLAAEFTWVRLVWLSRNYGQHAATLAGIASSGGEWIVTMDEDGQHNPTFIGCMLDTAVAERAHVVFAAPMNAPPHGRMRNAASKVSKWMLDVAFGGVGAARFNSFRLVLGEIGRGVAAYGGAGVYLDVALTWVAARITTCPVELRAETDPRSGYTFRRLLGHFWRMVLTSGTRGLRLVTAIGALFAIGGVAFAGYLVVAHLASGDTPEGWTSQMVLTAVGTGAVLMALGIIAEYLGVAVNMAMGKPAYLVVRDPALGPLGRGERQIDHGSP